MSEEVIANGMRPGDGTPKYTNYKYQPVISGWNKIIHKSSPIDFSNSVAAEPVVYWQLEVVELTILCRLFKATVFVNDCS